MGQQPHKFINVNTLVAALHCPNAGRIEYLRQTSVDERRPFRIPNLSYSPCFKVSELKNRLNTLRWRLVTELALITVALCVAQWLIVYDLLMSIVLGMFAGLVGYFAFATYRDFHFTQWQLEDYENRNEVSLPDKGSEPVAVHWWELVKSGFTPIWSPKYQDPDSGLWGKPWRILRSSNSRSFIPVVRHFASPGNDLTSDVARTYIQLLAANALLMERNETTLIEWGLVVDSRTLDAFAIRISSEMKSEIARFARATYERLTSDKCVSFQTPPENACRLCRFGFPRKPGQRLTELGTASVEPFIFSRPDVHDSSNDKATNSTRSRNSNAQKQMSVGNVLNYFQRLALLARSRNARGRHCDCGDIFRWAPPHSFWDIS